MTGLIKMVFWGIVITAGLLGNGQSSEPDLPLTVATQNYGHTRALRDGAVKVPGCAIEYVSLPLDALNAHAFGDKKFDVTEVEILPFLAKQAAGEPQDYVLVPVFLLREFQLRDIWIRTDRGIKSPEDLRGKKVGVDGGGNTGVLWMRGFLQSSAAVKPADVTWIDVQKEKKGSLLFLLESGQADAILGVGTPKGPNVQRLFPDYRAVEQAEFKISRVFPIMTALAVRADLVKQNAWLPEALFIAFSEAKGKAVENLGTENEPKIPLPWGPDSFQETLDLMGKNYWSYGVPDNPKSLKALLTFAFEQGIIQKEMEASEVFDPSTLQLTEK